MKFHSGHKSVLIAFIILILPILFIVMIRSGKGVYDSLPYFGDTKIENGDTLYHKVPPFDLTTSSKDKVPATAVIKDRFYLAHFFPEDCGKDCLKMFIDYRQVQEYTVDMDNFVLLSIMVGNEKKETNKAILKSFLEKTELEKDNWAFAKVSKETAKFLQNEAFLIFHQQESGSKEQQKRISGAYSVLIDKEGHIRGFYRAKEYFDLQNLKEDLRVLNYDYEKEFKSQ